MGQLEPENRGLQLVEPRGVAGLLERDLVARAVEGQHPDALGELGVGCDIAPPSPKQPRFLEGKNEEVATVPNDPTRPDRLVVPAAWAASSSTGTPRASISAWCTLPNTSTAITPLVRGGSRLDRAGGDAEHLEIDVAETPTALVGGIASALA